MTNLTQEIKDHFRALIFESVDVIREKHNLDPVEVLSMKHKGANKDMDTLVNYIYKKMKDLFSIDMDDFEKLYNDFMSDLVARAMREVIKDRNKKK